MKVLFLEWDSLCKGFMKKALKKKGYEVVLFPFPRDTEDTKRSEKLTLSITEELLKGGYDFLFSFNYFPVAAIAAKACKVTYVSWVYDSPFIQLYSETIKYETNRVFIFDSGEYLRLKSLGVNTVHFLPMAAPAEYYQELISNTADKSKYKSDITFVGSTYTEMSHYKFHYLDDLDEYTKGYLNGAIHAQKSVYGMNFIESILTPEIVENMRKVCPLYNSGDGFETVEWIFATYFIDQKITAIERAEILNMLSKEHQVNLYTPEPTPTLPNVRNLGEVNPYTEAPLVFNSSKINLNISLRSILNGIPLRAMDIMGSKGFLLTNYQSDFLEFFSPGEDFVYYESYENLMEKTDYYLSHDKERMEIADNGFEKIKKSHSYEDRIDIMLAKHEYNTRFSIDN
ncbi:MAG: glycosyltransferase [Butyrivibrio sp.]|nr:glycosyltransferase [Butyrivibrio sp.]